MGNSNAAQPLLNLRDEIGRLARNFTGQDRNASSARTVSAAERSSDTAYHDSMVRKANESFRVADEQRRAAAARTKKPVRRTTQRMSSARSSGRSR